MRRLPGTIDKDQYLPRIFFWRSDFVVVSVFVEIEPITYVSQPLKNIYKMMTHTEIKTFFTYLKKVHIGNNNDRIKTYLLMDSY